MIAEQPTRKVTKLLRTHYFTRVRDAKGSHGKWACPTGRHTVTIPDGHKTISPGVVQQVNKKIAECNSDPHCQ